MYHQITLKDRLEWGRQMVTCLNQGHLTFHYTPCLLLKPHFHVTTKDRLELNGLFWTKLLQPELHPVFIIFCHHTCSLCDVGKVTCPLSLHSKVCLEPLSVSHVSVGSHMTPVSR